MTKPQETEATTTNPASDDQDSWLNMVKLFLERSVMGCNQIVEFSKQLIDSPEYSEDQKNLLEIMPTEMFVAMHNVRVGFEEALLSLAGLGLPTDSQEEVRDLFIDSSDEGEGVDIELLFSRVVEEGGPEGFLPVVNIDIPDGFDIRIEDYQGSLGLLKELARKYQRYDFENVPASMVGACWKGKSNPFMASETPGESCSHLEKPQSASLDDVDAEELLAYQKMCAEACADANTIYGQFHAVGAIYRAAIH